MDFILGISRSFFFFFLTRPSEVGTRCAYVFQHICFSSDSIDVCRWHLATRVWSVSSLSVILLHSALIFTYSPLICNIYSFVIWCLELMWYDIISGSFYLCCLNIVLKIWIFLCSKCVASWEICYHFHKWSK